MLDQRRARVEELQSRGLLPIDAMIVASIELGESVEQVAMRLGMTKQAVKACLRRNQQFLK